MGVLLTAILVFFSGVKWETSQPLTSNQHETKRELFESRESSDVVEDTVNLNEPETLDTIVAGTQESPLDVTQDAIESGKSSEHTGPIRLQVLNGCGVRGIARAVAPKLRSMGFDVRESGNAKNFRHERSKVYDRVGNLPTAYLVADSIGIDSALVGELIDPDLFDIDVTVVVGVDFGELNFGMDSQEGD